MPVREYAPLCLTRTPAGGGSSRLGVDRRPSFHDAAEAGPPQEQARSAVVEAALHTGKTEKVKIEKKLTLEHLLPRDWEAHWPLVVREQSSDAHDLALQLG